MDALFCGKNLSLKYQLGDVQVDALKDLHFSIEAGKFTCLAGASGSGKSTLLNLLGLVEPMQSGQLIYRGRSIADLSESEMNHIRRFEIGFVFQSFYLIDVLTAEENVEYFLARQGRSVDLRRQQARAALDWVGLAEHRSKRPNQMSGGQRQRVAIARALAKEPKVVLADEPTANLDSKTGADVLALLLRLCRERGCSVVMASHDSQAIGLADCVIRLRDGQTVKES
ncbi:ABC transporter ATP-binding protein [bacterium]|nr:ABC transporter ATP-binding protein [bacterium]